MKAAKGFTLIELMIVVAILGLIAAIAMPKFGELVLRSKESSAKGALGAFRGAVDIYYMNNEGKFPADTSVLPLGYIDFIPAAEIPRVPQQNNPGHTHNNRVENYPDETQFGNNNEGANVWAYVNAGVDLGHVGFNCIHYDTRGSMWSEN